MIAGIRSAIYDLLLTSATLDSSNLFFAEAPQGEEINPYCVFSYVTNPMSRDTDSDYEELVFQISLYGTSISALESLAIELISILKNSESNLNASLSGSEVVAVMPQYTTMLRVDNEWWQVVLRYRVMIK